MPGLTVSKRGAHSHAATVRHSRNSHRLSHTLLPCYLQPLQALRLHSISLLRCGIRHPQAEANRLVRRLRTILTPSSTTPRSRPSLYLVLVRCRGNPSSPYPLFLASSYPHSHPLHLISTSYTLKLLHVDWCLFATECDGLFKEITALNARFVQHWAHRKARSLRKRRNTMAANKGMCTMFLILFLAFMVAVLWSTRKG